MPFSLHHDVAIADARSHLIQVTTTIRADAAFSGPLTVFMPVWTPGSYLVREYARHVESLGCEGGTATKIRKNAWRIEPTGGRDVVVRYRLYCNELTVRTNHVDESHAFLNGAATFLAVEGHEKAIATIRLDVPREWTTITALPQKDGLLQAPDLDTLVDSPIEVGLHRLERFTVLGKPHQFSIWPADRVTQEDVDRLKQDTSTILETEARLFGGSLPYDDYVFLLYLSPRGRGGLEHRSSCALLASPTSFSTREGYLDLLSLIAHEAFHAWNVKRIRPAGLTPYRYQEENYTRLLWWFEGATSYYDWRTLRTSKLCTVEEYLDHLASEIANLDQTHGRLVQSLEEASFDAWIKLYRPDENTPNSSISYYRKGEVVCALLDLELRARTKGGASLDLVLRYLWDRHGVAAEPVPEGALQSIVESVAGAPMGDLFAGWIRTPGEIDYGPSLARVGLKLERPPREAYDGAAAGKPKASLGLRARFDGGRATVVSVTRGAAAQRGGVDPGDELIAIGGKRVEGSTLDGALTGFLPAEQVAVVVARDGRLETRTLTLDEALPERLRLVASSNASPAERAAFAAWLGETHPSWKKNDGVAP